MLKRLNLYNDYSIEKITFFCMGLYLLVLNLPHVITIRETSFFLAIILATISLSRKYEWTWSPLKPYFLIWLAIAFVSVSVSNDVWHSLSEIKKEILYGILSFWLFYVMTKKREDFIFLSYFVLIGVTLLITASLYYYYIAKYDFKNLADIGIIYGKPTYFSAFMFISSVLCLTIVLLKDASKALRSYSLLLLLLSILAIYFARHRSGYLAIIIAVLLAIFILTPIAFKLTRFKKIILHLAAIVIMVPAILLITNKNLQWDPSEALYYYSHTGRWQILGAAFEKVKEAPLLGYGLGNKYFNVSALDESNFYAHNLVLSFGIMMGIPGIIILFILFGKLFQLVHTNIKKFYPTNQFGYVVSLSGALILGGFIVLNLTDDAMVRHSGLFFWSVMGMILGSSRVSHKTNKLLKSQEKMKTSVIITAWNESRKQLNECLEGINLSSDKVHETVVLINKYEKDPKRTADILDLVSNHPAITRWVSFSQNIGVARAWNVGVNTCEGDAYIILNGDCVLDSNAIEKIIEPFSNEFIGIVGVGGVQDGKKVETKGLCENIHGFCFAVRKETYREIGGFDNEFSPLADEVEYCARAWEKGWGVYIAEDVNYYHKCRISKKPHENIIYFGNNIERKGLDNKNNEYKLSLPWLGKVSNKTREKKSDL